MTVDRRALLRFALAGAAVPVLAACGDDKEPKAEPTPTPDDSKLALQDVGTGAAPTLQIADAEAELLAGSSRYSFGLVEAEEGPMVGAKARIFVGRDPAKPADVVTEATALTEEVLDRGLYVAEVAFPEAGEYFVAVVATTKEGARLKGGTRVTVGTSSKSPVVGEKMPALETPTTKALAGADPLCSRRPPCSMHEQTIAAAVRSGKPTVVVFSAPAFCVTDLCGPVVEIVDKLATEFRGKANFVHVEAYRKQGKEFAPALQAMKFSTEPWTYFVDSKGVVADRISGAFGSAEVRERLGTLGVS